MGSSRTHMGGLRLTRWFPFSKPGFSPSAGDSPIDLAAMPDLDDEHNLFGVVDDVDDAMVALSHSVSICVTGELFATRRAGVGAQCLDSGNEALAIRLPLDRFELLRR